MIVLFDTIPFPFPLSLQSTKAWPSHTMGQQADRLLTGEEVKILTYLNPCWCFIVHKTNTLISADVWLIRKPTKMRNTSPRSDLGQGEPAVDSLPFHPGRGVFWAKDTPVPFHPGQGCLENKRHPSLHHPPCSFSTLFFHLPLLLYIS